MSDSIEGFMIQCPECGWVQYFTGNMDGIRPHTRCRGCNKDLDVKPNLVPTDADDDADGYISTGETDNYTDSEGNIYVENADGTPTTIDLSILRAFYKIFTGRPHRGTKEDCISLIIIYLRSELNKL